MFNVMYQNVKALTPVIVKGKNGYQIKVEGEFLLASPQGKFSEVLQAWFDTFWAFSLEYPKGLTNTFIYRKFLSWPQM